MIDGTAWYQEAGSRNHAALSVPKDCCPAPGPEGMSVTCANVSLWLGLFMAWIMHREDFTPCPESVFYPSIINQSINQSSTFYVPIFISTCNALLRTCVHTHSYTTPVHLDTPRQKETLDCCSPFQVHERRRQTQAAAEKRPPWRRCAYRQGRTDTWVCLSEDQQGVLPSIWWGPGGSSGRGSGVWNWAWDPMRRLPAES